MALVTGITELACVRTTTLAADRYKPRKELGESNKEIVKLKKELEKKNNEKESKTEPQIVVMEPAVPHLPQVKVFCSICSEPIINTSLVTF